MNNLSSICLILRRVTRALRGGCLLPFSFMGAEQPGQHWLTACSPALPFHNQDKMSKKDAKCVLCLFLQHSKPVWELVLNSALLGPVFEWKTLVETESSSLHLIFARLSSGRCSQA